MDKPSPAPFSLSPPTLGPLASAPLSFALSVSLLRAGSQPDCPTPETFHQGKCQQCSGVHGAWGTLHRGAPHSVQTGAELLGFPPACPPRASCLADMGKGDFWEFLSLFPLMRSCFRPPLRTHLEMTCSVTLRPDFASPVLEEVVLPAPVHSRDGDPVRPMPPAPSPAACRHSCLQLSALGVHP